MNQSKEKLSFALCEALSWAVAGELLLTTGEVAGPLYPDTMAMYDNLWLRTESGRQFGIMNRLGGSLPDGRNMWRVARRDPKEAAAAIRKRDDVPVEVGDPERAALAFRVAQWLLHAVPYFASEPSGEPAARSIFCLGNLGTDPESLATSPVSEQWRGEDPRWLHLLYKKERPVGVLNFRTAEVSTGFTGSEFPQTSYREDGTPGCPLAYEVAVKTKSGEKWSIYSRLGEGQRHYRNYSEEGFTVELIPLFTLDPELLQIDSIAQPQEGWLD